MIKVRPAAERGETLVDWLKSKHTFSFGHYYDPNHMGFGDLLVINEDVVKGGAGFGSHPHRDMEIISYVLEGSLQHKDSLGTGSIIRPGEVQRMSAGTGIVHSEFNPSPTDPVQFIQVWIEPQEKGVTPSYEQRNFNDKRQPGQLTLLASQDGREESLTIHQDANHYVLDLAPGHSFTYESGKGRQLWVQVMRGRLTMNETILNEGDGASLVQEKTVSFSAQEKSEILIFDLREKAN